VVGTCVSCGNPYCVQHGQALEGTEICSPCYRRTRLMVRVITVLVAVAIVVLGYYLLP
jgi:hypothetical protein